MEKQEIPISPPRWHAALWIGAVALVYFLVARFSLSFLIKPVGIAAIWPPAGIFLSAVLLTRRRLLPWLATVLFLTDLLAELLAATPPIVSLAYAAALTGDALLSAWLLHRFSPGMPNFRKIRQVIAFLLLCVLLSNALMSIVAALAAWTFLKAPFWTSWLWWWSSDGVGSLLVTPLVMSLAFEIRTRFVDVKKLHYAEGALLLLLTAFLSNYAISHFLDNTAFIFLLNLYIFPFLIWAALRFGVFGAVATSGILAAVILKQALAGAFTQFGFSSSLETILVVQVYIALSAIPSILLASVVIEREQVEVDLRESEDKFKYVFENSSIGKSITYAAGEIHVNRAFSNVLGYSIEDLQHKSWQEITHPDDIELTRREMDALQSGAKNTARFTKRFLKKDGSIVWVDLNSSLRRDPAGKPLYFMSALVDITERKHAEEALHEDEQRLTSIYSTVGDVIFYLSVEPDGNYRFSSVNPAFASVTGVPLSRVIGRTVSEVIPEPSLTLVLGMYQKAIQEKTSVRWEETSDYPVGRLIGEVTVAPVFDASGNCTHLVGSVHDITDRVRAEEEVRVLNAALEQRVEERTRELCLAQEQLVRKEKLAVLGQLAGSVGHELRNPLGVINTSIYYLRLVQPDVSDKIKQHHAVIEHEIQNAAKIISDLLDFARNITADQVPVSVADMVQHVLDRYPIPPVIDLTLDLPPNLPLAFADPHQVEQVLGNLVVNASQAMGVTPSVAGVAPQASAGALEPGGKLIISARRKKSLLAITVADTGTGIPPENMPRLFEPLFTTRVKGIGLGLAVSKKLVEANGGRIEVESVPGKGSKFTLSLPVASRKSVPPAPASA